MIIGLKGNAVVGKYDKASDAPEGVELIEDSVDLQSRSVKSLVGLHNKCVAEGDKVKAFADVAEAAVATFNAISAFELPVKEVKEKVAKEKKELVELPSHIGKSSVITVVAEGNPRREGTHGGKNFPNYKTGQTVGEYLAIEGAHTGHLRWDAERGFISIELIDDPPKPVKEEKAA